MASLSLNKVMLIGNATRDVEVKFTAKKRGVATFGLATNRVWVDQDTQEKKEQVEFHNIVVWGKLAEICGSLIHKGDKVFVEGRIQTRSWKGDDGVERKTTEITADNVILLKSVSGSGYAGKKASEDENVGQEPTAIPEEEFDSEDVSDDVPF